MISVLPLSKIVATIAVAYAMFMLFMIFVLHESTLSTTESMLFMTSGFAGLNLAVGLFLNFGWKYLWKYVPALNRWIFPDLNGQWEMCISWVGKDEAGNKIVGAKNATAIIKQSIVKISMEVESEDSDSETIVAKPKKAPNSDRPELFYAFAVTPHEDRSEFSTPYKGMALLKLGSFNSNELSGNYFTDRQTKGRFTLQRCLDYSADNK